MSDSPKLPPFVDPRYESAYWEARARVMWGQSRADVREWLQGHPIRPADIEAMLDSCFAERAQVMRRKGLRDLLLAAGLIVVGAVALWIDPWGGVLLVYSVFHLFRGIGRLFRGAKAAGTVSDSAEGIGPW